MKKLKAKVTIGVCVGVVAALGVAGVARADGASEEWSLHGGDAGETRYSPLDQIDTASAGSLGLAWSYELGTRRGLEATPLMKDGVLYVTGTWSVVHAVDAKTGRRIWRYDPQVPRAETSRKACCDVVNRGVAYDDGRIFVGTLDGRLIALDAKSGNVVWETLTVNPEIAYTITGAPRIAKGKVLIGNGGGEYGVRGYVSAYDSKTGKLAWRFYTVPGDPSEPFEHDELEAAAKTWKGEWWKVGGGGTVWDSMAYDPELDLVYVGTGNSSPWSRTVRSPGGGDNLYVSSILALRPDTGKLVWHFQLNPGDRFDHTATQHILLTDLEIDGRRRKVLLQAPKNGFFYVLDRETGEFISGDAYVKVTWTPGLDENGRPKPADSINPEKELAEIWPSTKGGHNWQPMSYSPRTGLVYVPAIEAATYYLEEKNFKYKPGHWNVGYSFLATGPPRPVSGRLMAWDPVARKPAWHVDMKSGWNGGTLATAGDVVFQGTGHKTFAVYDARNGKRLYETVVPSGIIGAPITYTIEGEQYVAVLSGWGGGYGLNMGPWATLTGNRYLTPGRLLVFKLGGEAEMPIDDIPEREVEPIEAEIDPELAKKGAAIFHTYCLMCHGPRAVGGGVVADVRMSAPVTYDILDRIVLEGAYGAMGMPSFGDVLTKDDVPALRAYLLMERAKLVAERDAAAPAGEESE